MKYNDDAQLDTSEVSDTRGSGGGTSGAGIGGGVLGLLIGMLFSRRRGKAGTAVIVVLIVGFMAFQYFGGSGSAGNSVLGQLGGGGTSATADNHEVEQECKTGKDANDKLECAIVADINSIQGYWATELPALGASYTEVDTVWFSGRVNTACGAAGSGAGPFYCPGDKLVYIDLTFYDQLKKDFGATGGPFVNAYVLAHEYGHHVQDLLGTESKVKSRQGASSDSVRLELQADCYAGVWAKHATEPDAQGQTLIQSISDNDITNALDAAMRIGDDYIQKNLSGGTGGTGGTVDTSRFTHGSSAQREKWFTTGYRTGDPLQCNTFGTDNLG